MARIQLRDTTIYIQDGLAGSAASNESGIVILDTPPQSTTTPGVAATTDEVQEIAQFLVGVVGTYTLTLTINGEAPFTTAPIAYNANAATVQTAIDVAATAASIPGWANGHIVVSGGPLTTDDLVLTFSGASVEETDQGQTTINGSGLTPTSTAGATDLDVDTVALNTEVTTKIPLGARFTVADEVNTPIHTVTGRTGGDTTTNIVFTPALTGGGANNVALTFLPQRIEIKIGEGDLSWTESRELIYDRDRDLLDTVRLGQEQPVSVELAFTFEYVTTQSGQAITPVDAIKRVGEASEWVSSSADLCEPYAVDIYVVHDIPCGTALDQDFLFQDFRYETLDYSMQDASISVSGQCNTTDVITTRADLG